MFSDIHVRTVHHEGEDYVNILDLANHLTSAMFAFANEIVAEKEAGTINPLEYNFSVGIINGLREAALLLAQGGMELRIENEVNTIDDLMNFR